jgi:hypothetical protein
MISYQLSVDSKKDPECLFCDGQVNMYENLAVLTVWRNEGITGKG